MRSVHQVSLDALRLPPNARLRASTLAPMSVDAIRQRAPKQVTSPGTLDFRSLTPEPGGLFDHKVFGPGTVIDAPPIADDQPYKPRKTQFARIALTSPIVHPLLLDLAPNDVAEYAGWTRDELDRWWKLEAHPERGGELAAALDASSAGRAFVLRELPVLPPDLRALIRLDDDRWQSSPLNELYKRVIEVNARQARLIEIKAPTAVLAGELTNLHHSLLRLFENEDRPEPVRDSAQRPLRSLRGVCGRTSGFYSTLLELDHAPEVELGRHYRVRSVLFGLGFELVPIASPVA